MKWNNFLSVFIFLILINHTSDCVGRSYEAKLLQMFSYAQKMLNNMQFDSAMKVYDSASKIALANENQLYFNYIKRLKCFVFIRTGQIDSAKKNIIDAKHYALQNQNDTLLAISQTALGYIEMYQGKLQECKNNFDSALMIYEKLHDTVGIGKVLNNYAIYYEERGEYDKALDCALRFNNIAMAEKEFSIYKLISLNTLGNIYEKLQNYDSALAQYEKCYNLSVDFNQPYFTQAALQNRSVIFMSYNRYDEAERDIARGIQFNMQNGDYNGLSQLYTNVGITYKHLGKMDLALKSYLKAMKYAEELNDEAALISVYSNLGVLYKIQKNYPQAFNYYHKCLKLAEKRNQINDIKMTYENLASFYVEKGDYKNAFSNLMMASTWQDSVLSIEKVRAIEEMQAKYESEKKLAQIKALKDENKINELEKNSIRTERNSVLGISITTVLLLVLLLFYFRMKSRKNRIIDAQRIQKLEDEKKLLAAQSLIVGQENERKRIAQELHDGIGVLLSTASIHFSSVAKTAGDIKTTEMLKKAEELLKQAGGEVRKISQNMMPAVLSKFGLQEALEDMFENLDEIDEIETTTNINLGNERLTENMEIMLYRVIQEMINNTLKHARAKKVEFSCIKNDGRIIIDFKDDGKGFVLENLPHNKSLGVFGIKSRIDFLKGKLKIDSGIGKGVHYQIDIPLPNA